MKKIFLSLCTLFVLISCEKENLLEGVELPVNEYENSTETYASITGASQVTCTLISIDLKIHEDRIPDTLSYTHVRVYTPFGDIIKTDKSSIFVRAKCNQVSTYKVTLYNETPEKETSASTFEFKTSG